MSKKCTWEEIDVLVWQWHDMPLRGNEAVKKKLENDIFMAVVDQFKKGDPRLDVLGEFFVTDWNKFEPDDPQNPEQRRSFRAFFEARMKLRKKDIWNQDVGMHTHRGKKTYDTSLDASVADEEGNQRSVDGFVEDVSARDAFNDVFVDMRAYECLALMLNLPNRLRGKAKNDDRINYFRLFFTDGVTDHLRQDGEVAFIKHERDLFAVMKEAFLDYFLTDICRTVTEVVKSDLKLYGTIVEGRDMTPVKQPLPLDVYAAYLNQVEQRHVGQPAISQQRTAYRTFMRETLC